MRREVTKRFRTTQDDANTMAMVASKAGLTFSEWVRQTLSAAVKAAQPQPRLPRDRWCTLCNMQPLTCDRIRPECERCNRLQQELGQ